jgi:hypothetical protein
LYAVWMTMMRICCCAAAVNRLGRRMAGRSGGDESWERLSSTRRIGNRNTGIERMVNRLFKRKEWHVIFLFVQASKNYWAFSYLYWKEHRHEKVLIENHVNQRNQQIPTTKQKPNQWHKMRKKRGERTVRNQFWAFYETTPPNETTNRHFKYCSNHIRLRGEDARNLR